MLSLRLIPDRLVRKRSPLMLGPTEARLLSHADLSRPGMVARGLGTVRANFASGSSSQVTSCGVFTRRGGGKILVWATASGTWAMQPDVTAAYDDGDF